MLKVVVDTNILVSASFWKGKPYKIMQAAAKTKIEVFTSRNILDEYAKALKRDFKTPENEIKDRTETFMEAVKIVTPKTSVDIVKKDPTDNKFIEVAIEAHADYIVSGDKHLLDLKTYKGINILSPSEFIKLI